MRKTTGKAALLLCAMIIAAALPVYAEEGQASGVPNESVEEQGVQEIQQLLEVSEVENTDGMGLEELTEAFSEKAMSDYYDGLTGFSMQYPSIFFFDEEKDATVAATKDGSASLSIENLQGGTIPEEMLLEAIKLETPNAEPRKYEQNGCLRVDRTLEGGKRMRTDLYLVAKGSFHHVTLEYPAEDLETYGPYIEYMINTMETKESEQG